MQLDQGRNDRQIRNRQRQYRSIGIQEYPEQGRKFRSIGVPQPRDLRDKVGDKGTVKAVVEIEEGGSRAGEVHIAAPRVTVTETLGQRPVPIQIGNDRGADMPDLSGNMPTSQTRLGEMPQSVIDHFGRPKRPPTSKERALAMHDRKRNAKLAHVAGIVNRRPPSRRGEKAGEAGFFMVSAAENISTRTQFLRLCNAHLVG